MSEAAACSAASTEPVYFTDSYLFKLNDAKIVRVEKQEGEDNGLVVVTDKTIMHPQGGGQPSDQGVLTCTGDGKNVVLEVRHVSKSKTDSEIQHIGVLTAGTPDMLGVGQIVSMEVSEKVRRLHARLHSAGHLLDAAFNVLEVEDLIPSKGYHFPEGPYVEYIGNVANEERDAMIEKLNAVVIDLIKENIPTQVTFNDTGERIVDIAGCSCPCGGTHIKSTGEIVGMKVTRIKKNKKNIKVSYVIDST